MKKIILWVLIAALVVGGAIGVAVGLSNNNTNDPQQTEAPTNATTPVEETSVNDVIAYLKSIYKDDGAQTPVDYKRFGIVRIAGIPYEVVWTADVGEEFIKVVVNDDGTVTIDINEDCEADTPYVLTATVTDDAGNTASHSWNYILPEAVDMISIVKEAYALKSGESLPYESTLRGKIISIKTPYDPSYKNVTVIIEIEGAEDMPIECYRLKGEGAEDLAIGDIITVTGTLKNYNGTIEFDAGCILEAVIVGERVQAPSDPKQIVDEAYALGANKSLPYEATLTGTITAVDQPYDEYYGNITVTMVVEGRESKPIKVYRLKGPGAEKIGINDLITVRGYITNYVGSKGYSTIEFVAGCILEAWEDRVEPVAPSDPLKIVDDAYALPGGQSLKYEATLTGKITKVNTPYDPGYGNVTVTMIVAGREDKPIKVYRLKGSGADKIGVGDTITVRGYITNYQHTSGDTEVEFTQGCALIKWENTGEDVVIPTLPDLGAVSGPLTPGVAYKMYVGQVNLGKNLYFNGSISGKFLETSVKVSESVDVFVEEAAGGVHFYFMDGETKTYLVAESNGEDDKGNSKAKFALSTTAGSVFKYDSQTKLYVTSVGNGTFFAGTYSTYNTFSLSSTYYVTGGNAANIGVSQFVAKFVESSKAPTVDVEDTEDPNADKDGTVLTVKQAIDKGLAMNHDTYTTVKYKVTGVITEVYETKYGNMKITDASGNILTLYGTYSADGSKRYDAMDVKPVAGDTITIYGVVGQYRDVAQIKNGWIVAHTPAGETPEEPVVPNAPVLVETPVAGVAYKFGMIQEAVSTSDIYFLIGGMNGYYMDSANDAAAAIDVYLEETVGGYYLYTMDGNTKLYINMVVSGTHVNGAYEETAVTVYTYDAEMGTVVAAINDSIYRFGTRNDKTYTTIGPVDVAKGNFYCKFYTLAAGDIEPSEPTEPSEPSTEPTEPSTEPTVPAEPSVGVVAVPEVGVAYKLGMDKNEGNVLYFNGQTESESVNYRLATSTNEADAIDVYLEAVSGVNGGYRLYFMNGDVKTYIRVYERTDGDAGYGKGSLELVTAVPTEYFTYDETAKTLIYTADADNSYYLGTYSTFVTFSVSNTSFITGDKAATVDVSQYPARFYGISGETPDVTEPTEPSTEPTEPSTEPTTPVEPSVPELVETPTAGVAYKFGMIQESVSTTDIYFLIGGMNGYYMDSGKDVAAAIDVYLEETEGGYYLYTMDGNTKLYINMVVSGTHVNGAYEQTATTVYTYDAEMGTIVAPVNDSIYRFGTRNDKTYTTIGPVDVAKGNFYCHFYTLTVGEGEPTDPTEPAEDDVLTIAEAIAMGSAMEHNTYTETKYKVTGVITEVYSTQYGNMKLTDEAGNILTIYGTWSADGAIRYDSLDVKPVAGDTVTIYGIVGQYNNVAQIKNGWIIEHNGAETEPEETEPTTPVEPGVTGDFTKITSIDQLVSGKYVLVAGNGYAPKALDGTWLSTGTPAVDGNNIAAANAAGYIWTITVDGSGVKLTDANGKTVAPKGGNNNGIKEGDYAWEILFADGTFQFAGVDADTVILACNAGTNGGNKFRGYKTTTLTGQYADEYFSYFTLYKLN